LPLKGGKPVEALGNSPASQPGLSRSSRLSSLRRPMRGGSAAACDESAPCPSPAGRAQPAREEGSNPGTGIEPPTGPTRPTTFQAAAAAPKNGSLCLCGSGTLFWKRLRRNGHRRTTGSIRRPCPLPFHRGSCPGFGGPGTGYPGQDKTVVPDELPEKRGIGDRGPARKAGSPGACTGDLRPVLLGIPRFGPIRGKSRTKLEIPAGRPGPPAGSCCLPAGVRREEAA
jgi:hypothetical protein